MRNSGNFQFNVCLPLAYLDEFREEKNTAKDVRLFSVMQYGIAPTICPTTFIWLVSWNNTSRTETMMVSKNY